MNGYYIGIDYIGYYIGIVIIFTDCNGHYRMCPRKTRVQDSARDFTGVHPRSMNFQDPKVRFMNTTLCI